MPRAAALIATLLVACAAGAADSYGLDPVHSSVVFHIGHLKLGTFWGFFVGEKDKFGSLSVDAADPTKNSITVTVPVASVDTHDDKRNQHLQSPDFFDAKQFPEMTFTSTSWKVGKGGEDVVEGKLTLHGETKPVTAMVTKIGEGKDPMGDFRIGYDAKLTIKRSDFGMTKMFEMIGDEVTIFISVEGVKKK